MPDSSRRDAPPAADGYIGGPAATTRAMDGALANVDDAVAVVLVEGITDQIALEAAAARRGRDLEAERVVVVPIGGAHAIGRVLARFAPERTRVRLAGLCDLREEELFRRELVAAGVGSPRTRRDMERLGFHVCVDDLEDELMRSVGAAGIERLFDAHGDLRSFRSFQGQPAWRGRDLQDQMYRFVRSSSRRNLRYVRLLADDAADRDALPRPLDSLLAVTLAAPAGPAGSAAEPS